MTLYRPPVLDDADAAVAPAPLLILHDGQNLFEPARAFVPGETWRVAETAEALIERGEMPPTVIAGVDHAGDRRIREFGGSAAAYGRFVTGELLPYLRDTQPIRRDAAGTAMGGSSMGALVTLRLAIRHPGVFGRLLLFSPSVWWKRRAILRAVRPRWPVTRFLLGAHGLALDAHVWLSVGLHEGDTAVDDARRLRDAILTSRGGDASRFRYFEDPDGRHDERSWSRQLALALSGGAPEPGDAAPAGVPAATGIAAPGL